MTKFKTVWFWHSGREATDDFSFVMSFYDDSHEHPSCVFNEKSPHHSYCHSFNTIDRNDRQVVHLVSDDFDGCCDVWYVYIDAVESIPPTRMLMAYADDRYPNGTVVPFGEIAKTGISPNDAAGFVRWFVNDSRIQQIYVDEKHRRKRISTKLFSIADMVIVSDNNWNKLFLNGGDVTTTDGELLRSAWSASTRLTQRVGSVTTTQQEELQDQEALPLQRQSS